MNFGSLYSCLRLTAAATQADIKSAYYRLSKIYHPDKTSNCPKAVVQFRNITEAYKILGNPKLKAAYDEQHIFKETSRVGTTKFRSLHRRHRFQEENLASNNFEEFDLPIQERMKQYRIKVEKNEK